jgi:hypothetical protein
MVMNHSVPWHIGHHQCRVTSRWFEQSSLFSTNAVQARRVPMDGLPDRPFGQNGALEPVLEGRAPRARAWGRRPTAPCLKSRCFDLSSTGYQEPVLTRSGRL